MKELNCILLIDDNPDDNFYHTYVINEAKAAKQVKAALTGEEALVYFEKTETDPENYPYPDLVFLDINMPGMNGFEFLEVAKERKIITETKPVVVIMLSSSLNPFDETKTKKDFFNEVKEFQNKPLTIEMLEEIMNKYF
ncbi:MAG: response regulator [Chitinophagaceae bacterium]|nr:MAG: response regulator [Chitinophagaceae bacterium]